MWQEVFVKSYLTFAKMKKNDQRKKTYIFWTISKHCESSLISERCIQKTVINIVVSY